MMTHMFSGASKGDEQVHGLSSQKGHFGAFCVPFRGRLVVTRVCAGCAWWIAAGVDDWVVKVTGLADMTSGLSCFFPRLFRVFLSVRVCLAVVGAVSVVVVVCGDAAYLDAMYARLCIMLMYRSRRSP